MKISASKASLIAVIVAAAGIGLPAMGQDVPESLLPPGFDDPAPAPAPRPTRPAPTPRATATASSTTPAPSAAPAESGTTSSGDTASSGGGSSEAERAPVDFSRYELPDYAKRSTSRIGAVAFGSPPVGENAFGRADGRFLRTAMRRLDTPIASRWVQIALRRTLMSPLATPPNIEGADFAAERAWLMLRMGEAVAARAVIQDVDVVDYTPWMFQVAMQVALATADPAALCPLVGPALEISEERSWIYAQAMCAGLAGEPNRAGKLIDAATRGHSGDIDALLAEKVVGAGAQGRRAVTIEWGGVDRLTAWRYGLAMATAVEIPAELFANVGPQVRYWYAASPMPEPRERARWAELAAAQGVFSNSALVDLYGLILDNGEGGGEEIGVARDLRVAYIDGQATGRIAAMRRLWDGAGNPRRRYGRMILTARAAARIAPNADLTDDADLLIASMLSAGLDGQAMAWRDIVPQSGDGWAMLTLADPAPHGAVAYGEVDSYRAGGDRRKAQLLFAGLAGLGRMADDDARRMASALDVQVGGSNVWTDEIDAAGRRGDAGMVILLAAMGMQSSSWASISPEALFHIVAALRAAGMEGYARMIAVEAIARA